jgi:two-component system phosphate regulon response regulator PhoB
MVLVVEDDAAVRDVIRFSLERAGYSVTSVPNASNARSALGYRLPDLVVLDLVLPDMNGIELLQSWRHEERTRRLPVIILTGRADERDRIVGFRAGADDYMVKPFSRDELLARIEAILKRVSPADAEEVVEINGLRLDSASVRVTANRKPVPVGPLEFRLLRFFMTQPNRVHSRGEIIDHVWRSKSYVDPRAVDVQIRRLRRLLEDFGYDQYIETVRGVGYKFTIEFNGRLPLPGRRAAARLVQLGIDQEPVPESLQEMKN